eukprot:GFYU01002047.1.p1 GENE.GFYU01002047.1~~GFYU01002047.1.p1  ORF type:complete len:467 (+),score=157.61 GFYU01002047.1:102-1502(+)
MKISSIATVTIAALVLVQAVATAALFDFRFVWGTEDNGATPSPPAGDWGYSTVRPKVHLFWWLQLTSSESIENAPAKPLIIWLQGGPGAASTGYGNFQEIGPLTDQLQPREKTWLKHANLLFIDSPVGTGYSYVEGGDTSLFTHNNDDIARDLLALLKDFYSKHPEMQKSPLYVFSESYGGKMTTGFGNVLHDAIQSGDITCDFKGVALGDSWISGLEYVKSWPVYLQSLSLLDDKSYNDLTLMAHSIEKNIESNDWAAATASWGAMEGAISEMTAGVNFYNVLQHNVADNAALNTMLSTLESTEDRNLAILKYNHLATFQGDALSNLMNGPVKQMLGSKIPSDVVWGKYSGQVFAELSDDFMKPVVDGVDQLLSKGVNVHVYTGQLDLICDTLGTEAWMRQLKWAGMSKFQSSARTQIVPSSGFAGFKKAYENLSMYYIMNAGHMVPGDNPDGAMQMMLDITDQL